MKRKFFSSFSVLLVLLCVWTAYANVLSDDADVRAKARATVDQAAGCGDDCKLEGLRGDRGMLEERIEYDVVKHGRYVVVCRRALIVAGDHACEVTEQPSATRTPAPRP
ncbi:MAG: hypothetical protein KF764_25030 [Labilithrix sp.]|nr:hypothetical protein [Labilithrix sp.]MBX3224185.1 hypothetical protein [Labilithrix sp.]